MSPEPDRRVQAVPNMTLRPSGSTTVTTTTIWERWDSMLPDGSINPGSMTSFNHYALGAVADFLHRVVGGLSAAEPGWTSIHIEPRPGGGLTRAAARYKTPFGLAASNWHRDGECLTLEVTVPPDVRASVVVPGSVDTVEVGPGTHSFETRFRAPDADPPRPRFGFRRPVRDAARR